MNRWNWRKFSVAAAVLASLGTSVAWGESAPADASQVVVIREQGKPERRCVIEQADRQPDSKVIYLVRDLATGERLRILDGRTQKSESTPIVRPATAQRDASDAGMIEALGSSPVNDTSARLPTTAELAGAAPLKKK